MKIFKHMNTSGEVCPICKTNKDKEVTLVIMDETEEDGIAQALQVHVDCLELRSFKSSDGKLFIYQIVK